MCLNFQELDNLYPSFERKITEMKNEVEINNRCASANAQELYRSKMNDLLGRSQRFLTEDELLSEHNNIKNVAMNHFTENPTIGGIKDISKPFENNLCQVKFLSKLVLVN